MRQLRDKLDRFCYKYEHRGIRNLTLLVIIIKVSLYILNIVMNDWLVYQFYFHPLLVLQGQWWRLFSFLLVPDIDNLFTFLLAMLIIYSFGTQLEQALGRMKYTLYYASGLLFLVVFAGLCTAGVHFFPDTWLFGITFDNFFVFFITAYPLKVTLLLAYASVFPDANINLFFIIPIKAKWLAIISAALLIIPYLRTPYTFGNLYPLAALGNYLLFFAPNFVKLFKRKAKIRGKKIEFEKAVRDKRRQFGYSHKCVICGVTDIDEPGMEFRYCSLCSGYQCYCSKHIFAHEHTKG